MKIFSILEHLDFFLLKPELKCPYVTKGRRVGQMLPQYLNFRVPKAVRPRVSF